jgi:UDP-glucose-4-epimerase GalE
MSAVLVTGGAGYIGSHTVRQLARSGFDVVVFDNFSAGRREFVKDVPFVEGDLLDKEAVRLAFKGRTFMAVLHFASLIQVGESWLDPRKYYTHNLISSLNLLDAMLEADVRALIFSSSAAVYGDPLETPIPETHPLRPSNPYGRTKRIIETALQDYDRAYSLRSISLRYFNAAGADPQADIGEAHDSILLRLLGKTDRFCVFGNDFPTPDGTAVRDYIHVNDLAVAHVLALESLLSGGPSDVINLGTNRGASVFEVIRKVEEVTGRTVPYEILPRRKGDVGALLASKERAEQRLGWKPRVSDLETIVRTAWNWHRGHARPS